MDIRLPVTRFLSSQAGVRPGLTQILLLLHSYSLPFSAFAFRYCKRGDSALMRLRHPSAMRDKAYRGRVLILGCQNKKMKNSFR